MARVENSRNSDIGSAASLWLDALQSLATGLLVATVFFFLFLSFLPLTGEARTRGVITVEELPPPPGAEPRPVAPPPPAAVAAPDPEPPADPEAAVAADPQEAPVEAPPPPPPPTARGRAAARARTLASLQALMNNLGALQGTLTPSQLDLVRQSPACTIEADLLSQYIRPQREPAQQQAAAGQPPGLTRGVGAASAVPAAPPAAAQPAEPVAAAPAAQTPPPPPPPPAAIPPVAEATLRELPALSRSLGPGSLTVGRIQLGMARVFQERSDLALVDQRNLNRFSIDGTWGPITQKLFDDIMRSPLLRERFARSADLQLAMAERPPSVSEASAPNRILYVAQGANRHLLGEPLPTGSRLGSYGPGTPLRIRERREIEGTTWILVEAPPTEGASEPEVGWTRLDSGLRREREAGGIAPDRLASGDVSQEAIAQQIRTFNSRRRGQWVVSEADIARVTDGLARAAREVGSPVSLSALASLCLHESKGHPGIPNLGGHSGARGLCQIVPGTWEAWRRSYERESGVDVGPFNPNVNDPYKNALLTARALKDGMTRARRIWSSLEGSAGRQPTELDLAGWAWIGHFRGSFGPGMALDTPPTRRGNPTPREFRRLVTSIYGSLHRNEIRNREAARPAASPGA